MPDTLLLIGAVLALLVLLLRWVLRLRLALRQSESARASLGRRGSRTRPEPNLEVFEDVRDFPPLEFPTPPESRPARAWVPPRLIEPDTARAWEREQAIEVARHLREEKRSQVRYLLGQPWIPRPAPYRPPTHWIPYPSLGGGRPAPAPPEGVPKRDPILLIFRRHFLASPGWYVMNDEGRGLPLLISSPRYFWTPAAGPFAFDELFIDTATTVQAKTTRSADGESVRVPDNGKSWWEAATVQ